MPNVAKLSDPTDGGTARQVQNGVLTIMGMAVTPTQTDMGYAPPPGGVPVEGTLDIVIQAETVTLNAPLVNPGRKVTIIAHRLVVSPGASIDVSGAIGNPNWAQSDTPDPTDTSAGATGPNGANGGTGGAGGSIILYVAEMTGAAEGSAPASLTLTAAGGTGGTAQVGGVGQPGAMGQAGTTPTWPGIGPAPGPGWGGEGGMGGAAGAAGSGGVGGSIVVNTIAPVDPSLVILSSAGGAGGAAAWGGMGGQGGYPAEVPPGPDQPGPGANGRMGEGSAPGAVGAAGTATLTPAGQFTAAALGEQATLALLQMIQQSADSAFLGASYPTAAALYNQLIAMTAAAASQAAAGGTVSADVAARAAINRACVCELSRLKQGLDFFGLRPDWAPTLTLAVLQAEIMAMLTLAGQFEASLNTLLDQNAAAAAKLQALTDAQSQSSDRLTTTQAQISAQESQLKLFEASLDRQQQEINAQLGAVQALQTSDLFAQQHPGCSTKSALDTCVSIASVAVSVESDYTAVTDAVGALADSGTIMDGIKNGISAITTIETTVSNPPSITSIVSAYDGIKSFIDPTTQPDGGKALVNEADYDAWVDQNIVGCAQQDDLKAAARRYFDLVKTRNGNVLSYNAALLQKERLLAEAAQETAAFESIAAQLAGAQCNPGDPALAALMQATDVQIRTYLLRRINDEIRALNYWTVNNDGGAGSGVTMPTNNDLATLTGSQTTITAAIDNAMSADGLPDTFQDVSITLNRTDHADAFAALAASADKRLVIRTDVITDGAKFSQMAHVAAETVAVTLPDYASLTTGVLNVRIVHGGSGVFLLEDGVTTSRFSHAIHTSLYQYDFGQKVVTCTATLGDKEAGFLGLSPFTDWFLDFGNAGIEIDFDTLSSVVLTFSGCSVPVQGI